jgi:hypothetical protein
MSHHEVHKIHRSSWLRAAVLGANDGIIATASLMMGVAAAGTGIDSMLHRERGLGGWRYVDGGGGVRIGVLAGVH